MAHHQEVMGFNPDTVYWTDVSIASCYIIEKYRNKGSHMGKTKKTLKFKKNELLLKKINFEKIKIFNLAEFVSHDAANAVPEIEREEDESKSSGRN